MKISQVLRNAAERLVSEYCAPGSRVTGYLRYYLHTAEGWVHDGPAYEFAQRYLDSLELYEDGGSDGHAGSASIALLLLAAIAESEGL